MFRPDMMTLVTPNLSVRRKPIRLIVLHHTGSKLNSALNWLINLRSRVSADFVLARSGMIYRLNPDVHNRYTWHAGRSAWKFWKNVNSISIGVELEHIPGEDWPDRQVSSCAKLCAWLMQEFSLSLNNNPIQSHRAVALPFGRKTDPEGFPWESFGSEVRSILEDKANV